MLYKSPANVSVSTEEKFSISAEVGFIQGKDACSVSVCVCVKALVCYCVPWYHLGYGSVLEQ